MTNSPAEAAARALAVSGCNARVEAATEATVEMACIYIYTY